MPTFKKPNIIRQNLSSAKNFFTDDRFPLSWEQKIAIADGKKEMPRGITLNSLRHMGDEERMQIQLQNTGIDPDTHQGYLHRIRKLPPQEQQRIRNMLIQREQQRMGVTPVNTGEYDRPIHEQPRRIYRDGGIINFRPELPTSQQSTISSRIDPEKELRLKKIQSEIDLLEKRERAYKEASPPHQISSAPGGPVEHEDYWKYGNQVKRNISTSKESIKNVGQNMIMPSLPYGRIFKAAKPVTGVMPRVLGNQGNPDHFNAMMGAILANTLQTDIAGENTSLISHAKQYYKKTPAAKRSKERIQEKMKSDELNWFQKRIFKKISE